MTCLRDAGVIAKSSKSFHQRRAEDGSRCTPMHTPLPPPPPLPCCIAVLKQLNEMEQNTRRTIAAATQAAAGGGNAAAEAQLKAEVGAVATYLVAGPWTV